jgi:transposase
LIGRRRWIYRNFAARVSRDYKTIIIKPLPVQRLSQYRSRLDAAARYRHWASPAELSLYVRQAARNTGAIVHEAESAFSTTTCAECGAQAVQSGNLILTCPYGHRWDQDENAARNLLSQVCKDSQQLNHVHALAGKTAARPPGSLIGLTRCSLGLTSQTV